MELPKKYLQYQMCMLSRSSPVVLPIALACMLALVIPHQRSSRYLKYGGNEIDMLRCLAHSIHCSATCVSHHAHPPNPSLTPVSCVFVHFYKSGSSSSGRGAFAASSISLLYCARRAWSTCTSGGSRATPATNSWRKGNSVPSQLCTSE